MAWKKLAFTDEILTNPMTEALDMDAYQIRGISNLKAYYNTGIEIQDLNGVGAAILATTSYSFVANRNVNMSQKDIENVTAIRPYDSVGVGVMMEDANGVDQVEFGIGNGSYAMVAYRPIDMNQKAFDGMVFGNLATAPHAASEVQGEAYYNTADDHIHVWVV